MITEEEKKKARYRARKTPLAEKCMACGSKERLDRHHPYYKKPDFVFTLCRKCHRLLHCNKDVSHLDMGAGIIYSIKLFTVEYECLETMRENLRLLKKMNRRLKCREL